MVTPHVMGGAVDGKPGRLAPKRQVTDKRDKRANGTAVYEKGPHGRDGWMRMGGCVVDCVGGRGGRPRGGDCAVRGAEWGVFSRADDVLEAVVPAGRRVRPGADVAGDAGGERGGDRFPPVQARHSGLRNG